MATCESCAAFSPLQRIVDNKGTTADLNRGFCLERTVFAEGYKGSLAIPPGAKTEKLPYNRHKAVIQHKDDGTDCAFYKGGV